MPHVLELATRATALKAGLIELWPDSDFFSHPSIPWMTLKVVSSRMELRQSPGHVTVAVPTVGDSIKEIHGACGACRRLAPWEWAREYAYMPRPLNIASVALGSTIYSATHEVKSVVTEVVAPTAAGSERGLQFAWLTNASGQMRVVLSTPQPPTLRSMIPGRASTPYTRGEMSVTAWRNDKAMLALYIPVMQRRLDRIIASPKVQEALIVGVPSSLKGNFIAASAAVADYWSDRPFEEEVGFNVIASGDDVTALTDPFVVLDFEPKINSSMSNYGLRNVVVSGTGNLMYEPTREVMVNPMGGGRVFTNTGARIHIGAVFADYAARTELRLTDLLRYSGVETQVMRVDSAVIAASLGPWFGKFRREDSAAPYFRFTGIDERANLLASKLMGSSFSAESDELPASPTAASQQVTSLRNKRKAAAPIGSVIAAVEPLSRYIAFVLAAVEATSSMVERETLDAGSCPWPGPNGPLSYRWAVSDDVSTGIFAMSDRAMPYVYDGASVIAGVDQFTIADGKIIIPAGSIEATTDSWSTLGTGGAIITEAGVAATADAGIRFRCATKEIIVKSDGAYMRTVSGADDVKMTGIVRVLTVTSEGWIVVNTAGALCLISASAAVAAAPTASPITNKAWLHSPYTAAGALYSMNRGWIVDARTYSELETEPGAAVLRTEMLPGSTPIVWCTDVTKLGDRA